MADWRQIQARIRKAKNSADAQTKLSELYQRTRDAMVAWELGAVEEKAERNEEAVKWYTIAAERFRRADWKKKAEEALARLGAPIPVAGAKPSPEPVFAPVSSTEIEPNHEHSGPKRFGNHATAPGAWRNSRRLRGLHWRCDRSRGRPPFRRHASNGCWRGRYGRNRQEEAPPRTPWGPRPPSQRRSGGSRIAFASICGV